MSDRMQINYAQVEEMAQALAQGAQQLESAVQEVKQILALLQGGGLVGDSGEAFADACQGDLIPAMARLSGRFGTLSRQLSGAANDVRDADQPPPAYR